MTTPDRLDTWSIRIAERAAPGEIGFAAQTARAYAAGGAPRRDLFSSPRQAPGGMGGGAVAVLPAVLDGLAYAAESLKSALSSPELNNLLSATGLLVGLRAERRAEAANRRPREDGTASPDERSPAGQGRPSRPSASPAPPPPPIPFPSSPRPVPDDGGGSDAAADGEDLPGAVPGVAVPSGSADAGSDAGSGAPTADVVRAALRMSARLRVRGLAPDEADELTARLIARLVTEDDPVEAAAFLDALVGEEPPPPSRGPDTRRLKLRRLRSAASGLLHRASRPGPTPHGLPSGPETTDQE
ncbi:hypothetical protein ACFVU0_08695 [Streptomyces sp. NPDC058122]|uniref:hypothetical protein n=1 Tax=Streptomyces sp. NPDC058122 TaxID=3346349 RepID=UPI0036E06861